MSSGEEERQARLMLEIEDLRFENDRLRTSIAERQAEILTLAERLATLQRGRGSGRVALSPLRLLLRLARRRRRP